MIPLRAIVLAIVGVFLAAPAVADTVLRVNIWPSPRHNLIAGAVLPWTRQVTAATDGRVTFDAPAAPLSKGKNIYDAVAAGVADVSFAIHGYTPARFPMYKLVEFPLSGNTAAILSVAYWRTYKKHFEAANSHKEVILLSLFTHGPGQIFTRDFAVHSFDDLVGVKMRIGGGLQREIARRVGIAIVAADMPRSYEILSRGTADGIFIPLESMAKYKLKGFLHNVTWVPGGVYNTSFMLIMNRAKWLSLAERDREIIRGLSGEAFARMAGETWDRRERSERVKIVGKIKLTPASPAIMTRLTKIRREIQEDWITEVGDRLGVDGKAALATFQAEVAALASEMPVVEDWTVEDVAGEGQRGGEG